jgi:TPR repeat protein
VIQSLTCPSLQLSYVKELGESSIHYEAASRLLIDIDPEDPYGVDLSLVRKTIMTWNDLNPEICKTRDTERFCFFIGLVHDLGIRQSDRTNIVPYYQRAADAELPCALTMLGQMYTTGRLVNIDTRRGIKYLKRAIQLGNTDAMCDLAMIYKEGIHAKVDLDEFLKLLEQAKDKGSYRAAALLGQCYIEGYGQSDIPNGAAMITDAAKSGDLVATSLLGFLMYKGICCEMDKCAAIKLWEVTSKKGSVIGCILLGKAIMKEITRGTFRGYEVLEDRLSSLTLAIRISNSAEAMTLIARVYRRLDLYFKPTLKSAVLQGNPKACYINAKEIYLSHRFKVGPGVNYIADALLEKACVPRLPVVFQYLAGIYALEMKSNFDLVGSGSLGGKEMYEKSLKYYISACHYGPDRTKSKFFFPPSYIHM